MKRIILLSYWEKVRHPKCGKQNNGLPKTSISQSPELVNMLPYMEKRNY